MTATAKSQGPLFTKRALFTLIWPLLLEQTLSVTMGMADTLMVAGVGEAAVSSVSLVDSLNILIIQILSALATGGAVIASQYLGRRDEENASRSAAQLYSVLGISTVAVGVVCLLLSRLILRMVFGSIDEDVMRFAQQYFLISAVSYPFIGLYNGGAALFRAQGNSRISMLASLVMNVINIAGNALLIFGFGMGAAGAGIGTLVSRIAAAVIIMALLYHPDHVLRVECLLRFEFRGAIVKRILFIGIPNGMENGMFQAGKLMVLNLITTFGTSAVAANAIANSVAGVINVPGMALGLAIITVIGQCMGAGETGQAVYYTKRLVGASYLCMLVMSAALFFSAGGLVTLFHLSPEACTMAAQVLRACAVVRRSLDPWIKPRQHGPEGPEVLGPAPAPILKINNRYRYRVLVKCRNDKEIRAILAQILRAAQQDRANKGLSILIDVDPMDG